MPRTSTTRSNVVSRPKTPDTFWIAAIRGTFPRAVQVEFGTNDVDWVTDERTAAAKKFDRQRVHYRVVDTGHAVTGCPEF